MSTMRAFVVPGPGIGEVHELPRPVPLPGEALVAVERVGVCGTDVELFAGTMAYLEQGHTTFPLRLGHEWTGTVVEVGRATDSRWIGSLVVGDTMLGCGHCRLCLSGRQHVCRERGELGVRDGRPGALAEYVVAPVSSLHRLPENLDPALGALVEPGGNAWRAAQAATTDGAERVLIAGPGTIGLLTALFVAASGTEVHLLGVELGGLEFATSLGLVNAWTADSLPDVAFDSVVDATNATALPRRALDLVEPGGRVVLIGLAGEPSTIDTRVLALKDVTAVGILSASPGLAPTVAAYTDGSVDPRPLIAATVGLDDVAGVLAGHRPHGAGAGPKVHVDPRR